MQREAATLGEVECGMGKIVAIGGGEIGEGETLAIDKEIVSLTGKDHPRALFIPTASSDSRGYGKRFKMSMDQS